MSASAKTTRCTVCRAEFSDAETKGVEFSDAETKGVSACPSCGSASVPCLIDQDVTIAINWHELRILGIWASNYANAHCTAGDARKSLAVILHAIACQHPELAQRSPLTLAGEIGLLRDAFGADNVETNVRDLLEDEPCGPTS